MQNQQISRTVQDVPTTSAIENSFSIFQISIESTRKRIKGVVILKDDVLVYGTTKEQPDKRMLAVKSRLREKNLTINGKKFNSNQLIALASWVLHFKGGKSLRPRTC